MHPTEFPELDAHLMGGFEPGSITILYGEPKVRDLVVSSIFEKGKDQIFGRREWGNPWLEALTAINTTTPRLVFLEVAHGLSSREPQGEVTIAGVYNTLQKTGVSLVIVAEPQRDVLLPNTSQALQWSAHLMLQVERTPGSIFLDFNITKSRTLPLGAVRCLAPEIRASGDPWLVERAMAGVSMAEKQLQQYAKLQGLL